MSRRICMFEAAMNGMILSRTTMATTDQTDCAIALAAGGEVRAVLVSQFCSGQRASRPATPTNRRMGAAVAVLRATPGGGGGRRGNPEPLRRPRAEDKTPDPPRRARSDTQPDPTTHPP